MTAKELISELARLPSNQEVMFWNYNMSMAYPAHIGIICDQVVIAEDDIELEPLERAYEN